MTPEAESTRSDVDGVSWEVRPEWLASHYWFRVYVAGHPKVLLRYQENALAVAATLAADEARFRREAGAVR